MNGVSGRSLPVGGTPTRTSPNPPRPPMSGRIASELDAAALDRHTRAFENMEMNGMVS